MERKLIGSKMFKCVRVCENKLRLMDKTKTPRNLLNDNLFPNGFYLVEMFSATGTSFDV